MKHEKKWKGLCGITDVQDFQIQRAWGLTVVSCYHSVSKKGESHFRKTSQISQRHFAVTRNSDFTTPTWVCPSIIFFSFKLSCSCSPSFKHPSKVSTNLNCMFASWIYVCPSLCSPSCLLLQKQNRGNDN